MNQQQQSQNVVSRGQRDAYYNHLRAIYDKKWFQVQNLEAERERLLEEMKKVNSSDYIPPLCRIFVQHPDGTISINPEAWDAMNSRDQGKLTRGEVSGMVVHPFL